MAILTFLTVALPYYGMSRAAKTGYDFRPIIAAFVYPMLGLAVVGLFETAKNWHLYHHLSHYWGADDTFGGYLYREGLLRAYGPGSQPIVLGTVFQIAIGLLLCLNPSTFRGRHRLVLIGILCLGLLSTVSRGPMVGLAVTLFLYVVLADGRFRNFGRVALIGLFVLWPLTHTAVGQQLLSFLPFIGDIDPGSISYREKLFDNSMIVIARNPIFGSANFMGTPEMVEMIQGEGIIDIVNTYLQVALEYGLVGLFLFVSIFISVLFRIRAAMKTLPADAVELKQLGAGLFATLCGILVTIATVSSIKFIPLLYWSLAGLGVAYVRAVEMRLASSGPEPVADLPSPVTPYIR
jgi:O-antigen ligase